MAAGTILSTLHGFFDLSGAALKTKLDAIVLSGASYAPGQVHLIHVPSTSKVMVIQTDVNTG